MKAHDIAPRLRAEVEQWFTKQCRNPLADFYLYHLPASPEHDGGIIICENQPPNPEYVLSDPQRLNKGRTVEQNIARLSEVVSRLPILD